VARPDLPPLVCTTTTMKKPLLSDQRDVSSDGPDDVDKKSGEKANVLMWNGKNVKMRLHKWEAAKRDELAAKWHDSGPKEREQIIAVLRHVLNEVRAAQDPQEQLLTPKQVRSSITNAHSESRNQKFVLLNVTLPSVEHLCDLLIGELTQ
jgi:hypothetical protein